MNHQKFSTQLGETDELRWPVIEFDPNLKVEFDDESDLDFEFDSSQESESKE